MIALLNNLMTAAPIWLIGIILFGGMLAAARLGSWLRRRHEKAAHDKDKDDKSSDQEGLIVSSVMGLLALLVGFTFSLALDRFDGRRTGVLEEANAIGTTYLQTQLLDAPHRERISQLLMAYASNRLTLSQAAPGAQTDKALAENDRLVNQLWTAMVAAFPSVKGYDFSSTYVSSMNLMIDMDAARRAARRANIPGEVLGLLLIYQLVAAGVVGYVLSGDRGRQSAAFLFLLFGLSLLVIIDLDRPIGGWIRVSQQPTIDLLNFMKSNPPAAFGGAPASPPATPTK
jgi:hypothetical protein